MWWWATIASAAELVLPVGEAREPWLAALAAVEEDLPLPADAQITLRRTSSGWEVEVVRGSDRATAVVPWGETARRDVLVLAAALLRSAPPAPLSVPPPAPRPVPRPIAAPAPPAPAVPPPAPVVVAAPVPAVHPSVAAPSVPPPPPPPLAPGRFGVSAGMWAGTLASVGAGVRGQIRLHPMVVGEVNVGWEHLRRAWGQLPPRDALRVGVATAFGPGPWLGPQAELQVRSAPSSGWIGRVGVATGVWFQRGDLRLGPRADLWWEPDPERIVFPNNGGSLTWAPLAATVGMELGAWFRDGDR